MNGMKWSMFVAVAVVVFAGSLATCRARGEATEQPAKRQIDLTICLDTSGSMSGLINAARQKLWDIVNELALARPAPELRVALIAYGSPAYANPSYIAGQVGLTNDLDTVYQKLMALKTTGGDEYVGCVVHEAVTTLSWSTSKEALKIIFVAGNESADQARQRHDYRTACADAIAKGIIVNSIYCGNATDGIAPGWQEVARLADGHFAAIDQNNGTVVFSTPFDDKIAALNAKLNETYVPFGANGKAGAANQVAQDTNSSSLGSSSLASRAVTKANGFYSNGAWDIVDARKEKDFDLATLEKEDLPENMQKMSLEEQKAHLDKMDQQRQVVQQEINDLATQRRDYVQVEQKKLAEKGQHSLDNAMIEAMHRQAEKAEFSFEDKF